ncbi:MULTISPECIES: RepB family DNA primase [Enterobacterales]|nr:MULTISPECIES: RepB family DNA primase [Enterobacterales]MDE7981767.1 RepB family DNA primase [Escherichia coli]
MASEYDADPASADSRHYGRLAGFTNRKDKHTTHG